jgi:GNAT superfamily N-acetyltransferase
VGELLSASYAGLLTRSYEPSLLAQALPHLVRPQPVLLASGTWYVAEDRGGSVPLLGCGGWTLAALGGGPVTPRVGHLRHFATRPDATRRGIASLILERCIADALAAGLDALECLPTLVAEPFYANAGFARIAATSVLLGGPVEFPAVRMRRGLKAMGGTDTPV